MKKIWIVLIAMLLSGLAVGQDSSSTPSFSKHQIQLLAGNTTAVGDFASTNANNAQAGYAESGLFVGLSYQYQFHENITATFIYQGAGINMDAEALFFNLAVNPSLSYTLEYNNYINASVLVGGKYMYGDKVKLMVNPAIGIAEVIVSERIISASDRFGATSSFTQEEATNSGFAFAIGAGVQFELTKLISLSFNYQYLAATAEVEAERRTVIAPGLFESIK